jgi:cation diffusion facilitator CzcD-associated flavoprotein CzcO
MDAAAISHVGRDVLIIGAGFSGIGVAISLGRAGLSDYLIVEQGTGFGGHANASRIPRRHALSSRQLRLPLCGEALGNLGESWVFEHFGDHLQALKLLHRSR